MLKESIEAVIERCRHRIDMSLDCNVGDILRLIDEIENIKRSKQTQAFQAAWHGMGNGD